MIFVCYHYNFNEPGYNYFLSFASADKANAFADDLRKKAICDHVEVWEPGREPTKAELNPKKHGGKNG